MATVEWWDPTRTYQYPNMDDELQEIKYSSMIYGGFATFSCSLFRKPWRYYPELAHRNIIRVRNRHAVVWEGKISAPGVDMTTLKIGVQADGPIERLKTRLSLASLGAAAYGGAWISTNLIGDGDLGYLAGTIDNGYQFPDGIDFSKGVYYTEAVTSINKADGYRYGFFVPPQSNLYGNRFDFMPVSTTPDYYLDIEDCDTKIQYTVEGIWNVLYVEYSTDGTTLSHFWWPGGGSPVPDATSKDLYERRDGKLTIPGVNSLPQAEQIAQIALDQYKRLRPASDITARKITDITGAEIPIPEVQAGKVLHIRGLNAGEFTLLTAQSINELSTWPIVLASPDIDKQTVTLSAGGLSNTLDKLIARMEMVKR